MVLDIPGGLFEQRDVRETPSGTFTANESVPIGAVLAWLKTFANTPALPAGYVECNGQVLNDGQSVYNTQTIPDLNGDNRFLRGNATSAGTGGSSTHTLVTAEIPAHTHTDDCTGSESFNVGATPSATVSDWNEGGQTSSTGGGGAHENKPPYYNIVWIMRIK